MKNAVFYYSYDGSCAVAADIIAAKTGAHIIELIEEKPRKKGVAAFIWAGFGAAANTKSKLMPGILEKAGGYDSIVVISPVWASKTVPAVNRFLAQDFSGKQLWALTVQADPECGSAEKILGSIKRRVEAAGGVYRAGASITGAAPGKRASKDDTAKQLEGFPAQL